MANASFGEVTLATSSGSTGTYSLYEPPSKTIIGGDVCHLCGARVVYQMTEREYRRRKPDKVHTSREYECGTVVETAKGETKVAIVGKNCLPR